MFRIPIKSENVISRYGRLLFFIIFCSLAQLSVAQEKQVTGTVTDADGVPLLGVNVIEKNTANGTTTDFDGRFEITTSTSTPVLVFSYVGFLSREVPVSGRTNLLVTLDADLEALEEVVVIGYGRQRRGDVNAAVSSINAEELEDIPQVGIDQLLQGRAAGVTVTQNSGQPGSAVSVRVRGVTSITGSNEPLYVIDGVPVSGDANNSSTSGRTAAASFNGSGQTGVSPLASLNPNDIASIDILKDASATAIYGSRGANGVVIITTKRGAKGETGKLTYNTYFAIQEPQKLIDVMDLQSYARLQNALAEEYEVAPRVEFSNPDILGTGTNWQEEIFQRAFMQNHQLSFSGSTPKVNYFVSGGFTDQEGIVIGSDFSRMSFRSNVDADVKEWLKIGASVTASQTDENITLNSNRNGIVSLGLLQSPDVAVRNPDGTFAGPPEEDSEGSINPVALALSRTNTLLRTRLLGNVFAELQFTEDLSFRTELGGDFGFNENDLFTPTYQWGRFENQVATLVEGRSKNNFWIIKNYFTYANTLGDHNITLLAGQEAQESSWQGTTITAQGFVNNRLQTLNNAERVSDQDEYRGSQALTSYYARALYSYKDRYGLTATIRADGSSKFDPLGDTQWGYFPSFSASWKVFEESFMEGVNEVINDLRIRAGYGVVGNQGIPNYLYGASLVGTQTGLGQGYFVSNISNPDLKWEESYQTNLGIEFSLFNKRLQTTIDLYEKISSDFLYQLPLQSILTGGPGYLGGLGAPYVNLGELQNRGVDLTLIYNTIGTGDFNWSSTLTFSHYQNEVLDLYGDNFDITRTVQTDAISSPITRTVEGQPIGMFYGYQVAGIFNDESQFGSLPVQFGIPFADTYEGTWLGDIQYVDVNGDGVINEDDRTFIGNPHPDFTFGLTNNFTYKNFDLSVFFQGSYGNDILNLTRKETTGLARLYTNQLEEVVDYWTPENTDTDIPRPRRGDSNQNLKISDRYIEDGSYLRIQNVNLGYRLPGDWAERLYLSNFKIYGSIQNLHTFSDYSGYDPEVGAFNQDALQTGVDMGRYPIPRTFSIGLNAEF